LSPQQVFLSDKSFQYSFKMAQRAAQIAGHLNYPQGLLAGQVAIITGSGQGIGAEAARLFANEGARVIVSDIDGGMMSQVY
jgi:3-oxoacyl-[acyl-carrier protein] reductase